MTQESLSLKKMFSQSLVPGLTWFRARFKTQSVDQLASYETTRYKLNKHESLVLFFVTTLHSLIVIDILKKIYIVYTYNLEKNYTHLP